MNFSAQTLSTPIHRKSLLLRLGHLSPADTARWGTMSVHQMICHLDDSYRAALGEKFASPATGLFQRTILKWFALKVPLRWPRGVPTRPEMKQGNGGTVPVTFEQDMASLFSTFHRFCDHLPTPCVAHPIFGRMTAADWMRWGYLHADHHLRQFGR